MSARFFAKKVGVYEARQFRGLTDWLSKEPMKGVPLTSSPVRGPGSQPEALHVTTAVGVRRADVGDWIVRGPRGRIQVIRAAAFRAGFIPVQDDKTPASTPSREGE